jgi:hypothetical protein
MELIERKRNREVDQAWGEIKAEMGDPFDHNSGSGEWLVLREIVQLLGRYSENDLDATESLDLFTVLIESGLIHLLPAHFQRKAYHFVCAGNLDLDGEVLSYGPIDLEAYQE